MLDWPLIGRNDELAFVGDALGRTNASGVILVGPAGVGKTRLATECLRLGDDRGYATARVMASRAASAIPFGALAPLLPPGGTAMQRGLNALRQATIALTERAAGKPLLLVVDDAQALDDASAVLLQQLASSKAAFLVVTLRTGELAPDSIVALWKDHGVERLTINPLSRDETNELLATIFDDEVDQATATMLWTKTRGNPLFLRELVMGAVDSGVLVNRGGRWQSVAELEPTERLSELVDLRLRGLSRVEHDALELVAFGEPLGVTLVGRLTDAVIVEGLERKGLVSTTRDDRRTEIRLAHPMYGEVLRSRTPALRARSISRRLAEEHEATGARRRGDALRVSLWRLDGGGVPPMPLLLAGTAQARFANDFIIALRLARTAFDIEPSFESGMMLLHILFESDRARECEPIFQALEPMARSDAQIAVLANAKATTHFWKFGDADAAQAVLDDALTQITDDALRDELASFGAVMQVQMGKSSAALARMERALGQSDNRPFLLAALACGVALAIVGRCADAVDLLDRALSTRVDPQHALDPGQVGVLLVHKSAALNEAGRIAEAYDLAEFTRSMAADSNDIANQGFSCVALARVCVQAGKLEQAAARAADALDSFRRWGHPGPLRWSLGYLALASAMMGDRRTAKDALSELDVVPVHPAQMLEVDIARARAWYSVLDGRPEEARELLRELARSMRESGQLSFEASALYDIARLGESAEVADRLIELAGPGQSALHQGMAQTAVALARNNAVALAEQAEHWIALGAMLYAAEVAVAATDAFRGDGDHRRRAEWARRSVELIAMCEGARTPALISFDSPTPLTPREREIATLAAQGLPSKVIAERLFVTSRTVDNHLARIYGKIGITSRSELVRALADFN